MWLPFICLTAGALLTKLLHPIADRLMQISLFILLFGLGTRVGADKELLAAIPVLGCKAFILCLLASLVSIILILLWEKLFLKRGGFAQTKEKNGVNRGVYKEFLFISWVVLSLVLGMGFGTFCPVQEKVLAWVINLALVAIYISVGVGLKDGLAGLGAIPNKITFLAVPVLILVGSIAGGLAGSYLFGMNPLISGGIGGSTGYYSLAAAMVTQKSGAELGFIAFLVNFFREVLTFFLTPLLARISPLAPIALGGATTMDTTLAVMKRCLGEDYTLIAFISGAILTLIVPFMLLFLLSL